jgi:hypothetical protein
MKTYVLRREQWIPASLEEEIFPFFSNAANLERITPPWVGFRILTPQPVEMARDVLLEYVLRLAGIPVRWRTRVTEWTPPAGFVDVQERGPYTLWEHTHRFEPLGDGVLMTDVVRYALPFGPLGRAVHALAVRPALAAIFDYRYERIREAWPRQGGSPA